MSAIIADTAAAILQKQEADERVRERRLRLRVLMAQADGLLDKAEQANRDGLEGISARLRRDIRRLEREVHEEIPEGPCTPQQAVDRLLEAQGTMMDWLRPAYVSERVQETKELANAG